MCPKEPLTEYTQDVPVYVDHRDFNVKAKTAASFLKNMGTRYEPPAHVFCSRELESGLNTFVKESMAAGVIPTDDMIRAEARNILKLDSTSADCPDLLEKFKAMHGLSVSPKDMQLTDEALLAEFDKELERVNFKETGVLPPSSLGIGGAASTDVPTGSISPSSIATTSSSSPDKMQQDFADLYHVPGATSSALRRKASETLAAQHGFANPSGNQHGLILTEVPLPVVERERVQRLNGSGEVGVHEWIDWSQIVEENEVGSGMAGML